MKTLTLLMALSLFSATAMALPSKSPSPILGEALDSTQQQQSTLQ